uniref:Periplasmic nitrate reductase, electron transfer subunit n=1 Tax=Candidatus Kentrum sp. LFY TaxID=2126342 RepID=A0A450UD75_9GAMM|nr:MAG: periplasmic nitrate reductase subunit NapB [Candidatus Kentron sp. LFY]VFJ90265.1 MAG: periplasmic nitrate reductase subunit NapB [Candidatus Kentron sp. LFY]
MMRAIFRTIAVGVILSMSVAARAELQSLRGTSIGNDSVASQVRRYVDNDQVMVRSFVQQPPLIPHSIEGYRVDLRINKCLSCHSWANYRKKDAVKISVTHFRDREGNELSDVAAGRYFCLQCHVPQTDMPSLVKNRFRAVDALNPRREPLSPQPDKPES